ncbi:hypothetical protein T12_9621 [Trichinella patagoniensis]|uniref:Uncharacterized protein n=1 Tax=Trichinella patagoniensis TaxID=990121 RepID=A0A0V0ZI60_9BILA|nr:hypothetical protein T12_9621 [Trichinella patagoniensis]
MKLSERQIDKGKDSVNPMTAWVLTKINGISRSADSWVVNANHKVDLQNAISKNSILAELRGLQ